MTDLDTRHPEFTVAIRGYDRAQVDDYIDYLRDLLADAEDRARDMQEEPVFAEHAVVGTRVAEIFALAEAEARELRERVSTEAAEILAQARTEAGALVDAAERAAREIKQRAQRDHEEMVAEFERDRDRIREQAAALELRKADAIGELKRLRELLTEVAGVGGEERDGPVIATGNADAITEVLPPGDDATIELPAVTGDAEAG